MSSLSIVRARELYERIIKDGANKQCTRHIAENDIANLSEVSSDLILKNDPKSHFNIDGICH
uniref:Uncharacterized protein n=1 Tax=uncultured bacterium HF0010_16H03 TaxID=710811 RepID=E0XPA1_9BACT|nr:hypothetical protein [uncultured bacterium HF0010_16H03]